MGLISRTLAGVGNAFLKASQVAGGVSAMLKVDVKPWDSLYGRFRQQDYDKLVTRYSSWVYACASKNATSVAQVPLRLYGKKRRSGTKFIVPTKAVSREQKEWLFNSPQLQTKLANAVDVEEITQHPFLDLLANVNPFMNGIDLFELWTLYQELTGNAYTYVVKNNLGAPAELWLLPSQKVRIVPDLQTFIASYIYGTKPKMVKFESDEVMHMKYPNPHDLFYGMGPLAAATVAADSGMAMSTYELNLLLNDAIPRAALTSDRDLRQDQLDKLKKEWNANYRGPKKAGKLAVFTGGLGVERLSLTPKEMGFLMGRKSTREEVAAIFGVPMSKLSVENIQKAPAGGMFHGNIMYQRDTILPKCRKMDAKLNEFLLPMYDDNLFCAFDNPVGEDKEFRLRERESNMTHGYSSINQERIRDNQEPVEWGETPWLPAGLSQTDDESRSLSPSLSGGGGDVSAPAASFAGEGKYIDPDDLPSERGRLVRIVKRMFRLQAQEVLGNMPRSGKSAKIVEEFWLPHERNWTGWLAKESTPEMLKLVKKGAKEGAKKLAVGTGIQVNAPEIEAFVKTHAYKFARSVNAETMNILRTNMSEGIMAGENMYQIRKRVEETFTGMGKYRAEMIARTESVRAVNAGMEQGWEQSGVVEAKEWDGASDMCEFCQTMHAKYGPGTGGITLGNTFIEQGDGLEGSDGGQLSTSYGAIEYPPLHPNCRCDLLPVIKDAPVDKPQAVADEPKITPEEKVVNDEGKYLDNFSPYIAKLNKTKPVREIHISSDVAKDFRRLGGKGDAAGLRGFYGGKAEMYINPKGAAARSTKPRMGNFTVGDSIADTYRHEYGHHIYHQSLNPIQQNKVRAIFDTTPEEVIEARISKYAAANPREMFAESFSAFTHNGYKKGLLPENIESWLETILK